MEETEIAKCPMGVHGAVLRLSVTQDSHPRISGVEVYNCDGICGEVGYFRVRTARWTVAEIQNPGWRSEYDRVKAASLWCYPPILPWIRSYGAVVALRQASIQPKRFTRCDVNPFKFKICVWHLKA